VSGNYVGLDAAGTAAVAQPIGIYVRGAPNNTIGGTASDAGNVVSGNTQIGVYLVDPGATGNLVQGNTIGLDRTGTVAIPNGFRGVEITTNASNNTIGGAAAVARNVIASNASDGVRINTGTGNAISRNSIYANGGLGINLATDAVTLNDSGDPDAGANDLFNFPVITSAILEGANLTVAGFARPGSTIEFFIAEGDPTGFGEGRTYLFMGVEGSGADLEAGAGSYGPGPVAGLVQGTDTTNRFRFTVPLPPGVGAGTALTATATDGSGNTSEFGGNFVVTQPAIVKRAFHLDGTPVPDGATLPLGVPFRFLLYINNEGGALSDVSLADALDPSFAYEAGSMRYDNSVAACAAATCTALEEAAIYAAASAGTAGTDAVDGDVVSYAAPTLHAGNQVAANAQLDLAAARVWALLLTARMQ
jgi:parallel beta-helix repeat protein